MMATTPRSTFQPTLNRISAALALLLVTACQQPQIRPAEPDLLKNDPPAAGVVPTSGDACAPLAADWLELMPAHQRRIAPVDCASLSQTPLFSWGDVGDKQGSSSWSFILRNSGSTAALVSRSDITSPRLRLDRVLAPGSYEWSVSYINARGVRTSSQWRRFSVATVPNAAAKSFVSAAAPVTPASIPDGNSVAFATLGKARPRMLPTGSSYAKIAAAAQSADHIPVLNAMRARARWMLTQAIPASPDASNAGSAATGLAQVQSAQSIVQRARNERETMEELVLTGRLDGNAAMIAAAKQRLLALRQWLPNGMSSETNNVQANREVFLAIAQGLDLLWHELTAAEQAELTANLRDRILQTAQALSVLDRQPYDSIGISNVRWITQALLLATGLPNFPEAQNLLARFWDLSQFTLGTWGDQDGSFGNGIAYAWYSFNGVVPYVAAVRAVTGVNLYQHDYLRRAGEQLIAFTAPNLLQPNAFGDETETKELYAYYSGSFFRLHAQMTRNAQDAWYWRVNPSNVSKPNGAYIWQLLMLGVDSTPLPTPQKPTQNSWHSKDAGLAAMHLDASLSTRTSVFFRSSRFGAYNHSHADQNSVVYVSNGKPLLINSGYDPYYNSPHHKAVGRATRYKNTLTFDGGIGQSESVVGSILPTAPAHSMDANGSIIYAEDRGTLSAVTGDATPAYRSINALAGTWTPLLSNATRSVVLDRSNGITLIYDWATSSKARQWELNYHSPNAFVADASTVKATNGTSSVCLDRYGPATTFAQTMAWAVPPENGLPAQAHGRFTVLSASNELAHLTVLRDSCKIVPLQVGQQGSRITVTIGNQVVAFDKRQTTLLP